LCAHQSFQALTGLRRSHSDTAISCHSDKPAAFVLCWPQGAIARMGEFPTLCPVSENGSKTLQVGPPASPGDAGPQFESKVGAFYLLSLLAGSEPRGPPGAITRTVAFRELAGEVRRILHRRATRERRSQAAQLNIHRNRPCSVEANFKVHFAPERKLRHDLGLD
jgi:hypothetical protein